MKKLHKYLAVILASLTAAFCVLTVAVPAQALFEGSKEQACNGANLQDSGGCAPPAANANTISSTIKTILNLLSIVVGVTAVFMIIVGGMRFITSQGDSNSTAQARNTVLYVVVGLIVVVLAQTIVHFVINRVTTNPPPNTTTSPQSQGNPNGCNAAAGSTC